MPNTKLAKRARWMWTGSHGRMQISGIAAQMC